MSIIGQVDTQLLVDMLIEVTHGYENIAQGIEEC